jgi:4-hydroxybenzoate polyprenyltransferase
VSNQSLSPDEDKANKPWRPIPSGRVTVSQARIFRWMLVPIGLVISGIYGIPLAGLLVMLEILLMNEVNLTSHWIGRNITNSFAYSTLDFAATFIANNGEIVLPMS